MTALAAVPEPSRDEDDFLAFWTQHRPAEHRTILGVRVQVPNEVPLAVEQLVEDLKGASSTDDVEPLVAMLFGPDVFRQWKTNGVTGAQLQVLFAWGMANAAGKSTSFAEAAELVARAEAEGKALATPNRAARRAASSATGASAGTGRSSSRTTDASTASRRRK